MGTGLSNVEKNMQYMPAIIGAANPVGQPDAAQKRQDTIMDMAVAKADESARRRST